jgi:thymidylate synthase
MASEVGAAGLGDLVTVAGSAHVYEECWPAASALLERESHLVERVPRFTRDPRGSFAVRLEDGALAVDHYTPDGELLATHRGRTAEELRHRLAPFVGLSSHALYLGAELQKAELALRLGVPYTQDAPLAL